MRLGTWDERTIEKPWSPMVQPISSSLPGSTVDAEVMSCRPLLLLVLPPPCSRATSPPTATTAPAPSAKRALATMWSGFQPACRCRLHSSTAHSSTQALGSASTNARATRRPLKAPWQPMKPTWVRATSIDKGRLAIRAKSNPGAPKPVHDTVIRWVIALASMPASSRARREARWARSRAAGW